MSSRLRYLITFLLAPVLSAPLAIAQSSSKQADSRVEVQYQNPDSFTDMSRSDSAIGGADQGYLNELRQHIERTAKAQLPAGHRLQLRIDDVDMAGRFEPERGPSYQDVRIVKDIYPPRIRLHFTLTDGSGKTVAEGDRTLTNLAFTSTLTPLPQNDQLRHEKDLIDNFLRDLRREVK